MRTFITLCVCVLLTGADWPQYRGPNGSGVASDDKRQYPVEWSEDKGLKWSVDLPGIGLSSPVVFGDHVYVTACSGFRQDRLHVLAFNVTSGKKVWERQLKATGSTTCNSATNMAAPTPVVDETGVYALFATGDLAAFKHDGRLKWYRALVQDYPLISNQVGMAASPIIWKDRLILPMSNAVGSFVAAVDLEYGRNLWKVDRPRETLWVTPAIRDTEKGPELLYQSREALTAYDPDGGKQLWSMDAGMSGMISAVVNQDRIYAASGGVTALEPSAEGTPRKLWDTNKLGSRYGMPLLYRGSIYNVNNSGVLVCVDPKSGEERWTERVGGKFSASLVAGDGKIYLVDEECVTTVVDVTGAEPEIVGENELKGYVQSTPALADGRIFIRAQSKLYCVGE